MSFLIEGDVNFARANELKKSGEQFIKKTQTSITFDFSAANCNDSSVFAIILAWLRCARKNNRTIEVINFPEMLMRVGKIYGVEKIIQQSGASHGKTSH